MDVISNPRPNHKLTRCCGNCKFFYRTSNIVKKGKCTLPEGPKLEPSDIRDQADNFDPTHAYCYCDNHQWRGRGYLRDAIEYSGVNENEIG